MLSPRVSAVPAARSMGSVASALEEFPGLPTTSPSVPVSSGVETTTLPNGIRVLSQDGFGGVSNIGVYVRAGSRYEADAGAAHFLQKLAFKTTHTRSSLRVQRLIEDAGAEFEASGDRELLSYNSTSLRDNLDEVVELLADTILHPKLRFWEVAEERESLLVSIETAESDASTVLTEGLHSAAFGRNTPLGKSQYASAATIGSLDDAKLRAHLGATFNASNIVIAASNVDHKDFVGQLMEHWLEVPEGAPAKSETPTFVGGESHLRASGVGTRIVVGISAPSYSAKNLYAANVLQCLLGSTNSTFGPYHETGCQSRIPLAIAKDGDNIGSAHSFFAPYSDAGLLGVAATCPDNYADRFLGVVADTFKAIAAGVPEEELTRAKNHCAVQFLTGYEPIASPDMVGFQALHRGAYVPPADVLASIQAVTAADLQAIIAEGIKAGVAVSSIGSLESISRYDRINALFQ